MVIKVAVKNLFNYTCMLKINQNWFPTLLVSKRTIIWRYIGFDFEDGETNIDLTINCVL